MNRTRLLLLATAAAGCAGTGDEGLVIRNNLAPSGTSCSITASRSAPFQARGSLSTSSPVPYVLTPLIESRITAPAGQENSRTVSLMGARIDLELGPITVEDAQGGLVFSCAAEGASACFGDAERAALADAGTTKFRSLFSAPLAPNGGLSSASFDLVPTAAIREILRKAGTVPAGARLHAQVVATATVYGNLNGSEVEGPPYVYPVTVCNDCVVNVVGACATTPATFMARPGNPCNPYQDGVVDCCSNGGALVCPAVGML
ncbi:MAG TPA: hypothetical protein VN253_24570 [Kofleriaceae bacterium]|nr:hypothetical protein [Kofleriaceae bacterium]